MDLRYGRVSPKGSSKAAWNKERLITGLSGVSKHIVRGIIMIDYKHILKDAGLVSSSAAGQVDLLVIRRQVRLGFGQPVFDSGVKTRDLIGP